MKVLKPVKFNTPVTGQFIRGSTATYIEDGILKTAAINEPRWQDGKLLLEREATNLIFSSSDFNSVNWGKSATVSSNVATAPDGSITGDGLADSSSLASQDVSRGVDLDGGRYVFSVWIRSSSPVTSRICIRDGDGVVTCSDCDVSSQWTRFHVASLNDSSAAGFGAVWIYPLADPSLSGEVFAWGSQLERGAVPSSYIPTTAAPVTRAADVCVGNFSRASTATYVDDNGVLQTAGVNVPRIQNGRLLIEPAATNYCLNNNTSTPAPYNTGDSFGTITVLSDPFWGNVLRITKTNGTPGGINRVGARWILAAMQETVTVSIWIRRGSNSTGYAVYSDLNRIGGGFTSPTKSMADVPVGVWTKVSATASSPVGHSGGALYTWIDSNVGDYIDIALPCAFNGSLDSSAFITTGTPNTRAADIHTAGLVYTNATDARPLWSSATTYSTGQVIRYNNTVYESLQNTNLNKQPDTNPTWWLSLGADNITAAIDGKVGTKTVATDKLRMIIKPGTNIDSVGYIEATASTISTSAVDEDYNTVYSYKYGLDSSLIEDWYSYFFIDPLGDPLTQVVHQGINSLDPNLAIGVEIVRSGTVELGVFVTGQTTTIGKTQYGLRAGIVDYSKKEADEFGNVTIVERTYSKRLEGDVYVYNYDLNKVQRFLYNIRATPVLWIASDDPELAEVSNVYGFYKDFSTTISYPDVSMCSLQIEGLT